MKPTIPLLLCLAGMHFSFGQHAPREFGDVSIDDLKSTSCSIDSSASAVVLFDVLKTSLVTGYKYERHVRIKFFKNTSLNDWADANLVYNRSRIRLSKVKGATYNLANGQVTVAELSDDNIFETKIDKKFSKVSLALPKVFPGSIIEYTYTLSAYVNVGLNSMIGSISGANFIDLS